VLIELLLLKQARLDLDLDQWPVVFVGCESQARHAGRKSIALSGSGATGCTRNGLRP
jgi:hypothetical protein